MPQTSYPRTPSTRQRGARRQPALDHTRLTPAGQRLLDSASELFYAHGIHAVGVDSIADAAGTTKKTLYDRFGSKDALVALYLQRRAERWQRFAESYVMQHVDETTEPEGVLEAAIRRVLPVLDALEDWNTELTRGCAFVNAYAEIGGADHPGVAVIRAEKEWNRALYRRLLREAGVEDAMAAELGTQLALLQEGALTIWTAGDLPDAVDHARIAARRLLSATL